jgi:hypothetical protein
MSFPPPSNTPDRTVIYHRPDGVELPRPVVLGHEHPRAVTFCQIQWAGDPVMLSSRRPHLFIYNGLKTCAAAPQTQWGRLLRNYETRIVSGKLSPELLETFSQLTQQDHGFPRYSTLSGRIWRNLSIAGQPFSVASVWRRPEQALDRTSVIALLATDFDIRGPLVLPQ